MTESEPELDPETPGINDLMLQWHAGAASVDMVAFRLWALAGLAARLRFDGAIWGLAGETGGAHFHRTDPAAILGPEGAVVLERLTAGRLGRVVRLHGDSPGDEAHARLHGLDSAIGLRYGDTEPGGGQFLALRRGAAAEPFDAHDCATFELLAPHMVLAFSTCRKLQLVSGAGGTGGASGAQRGTQGPVRASALVDRTGRIHESDTRFVRTLRIEWADWAGRRLPDPLLNHKSRKMASRWQFLGRQIAIDFMPVNEMTLVIARARLPADALTAREWDIARRYASGSEYKEVAEALRVSPATVRSHLRRVFSKLNVRNKAQLAASLG